MTKFYFLTHDKTDPYFNIASEEYLLKHTDRYYIYLWQNAPAVIVGVNQNALEEVNLDYVNKNGIKVVRRATGGGAVYHDQNNICYSVIAPYDQKVNNFVQWSKPVIDYLATLGIKAEFSGRNDLTVDGKKISGSAQTVHNGRILHHGTLLFKTDLTALESALKPNQLKMQSKGIKSVKSRVANLYDILGKNVSCSEFFNGLKTYFAKDLEEYTLTNQDVQNILDLVKEKYSTYEWNFGYSPKGNNHFSKKFDFGVFTFDFDTVNGKIKNPSITGDFFTLRNIEEFLDKLQDLPFTKESLLLAFERVGEYIKGANGKQIVDSIFC